MYRPIKKKNNNNNQIFSNTPPYTNIFYINDWLHTIQIMSIIILSIPIIVLFLLSFFNSKHFIDNDKVFTTSLLKWERQKMFEECEENTIEEIQKRHLPPFSTLDGTSNSINNLGIRNSPMKRLFPKSSVQTTINHQSSCSGLGGRNFNFYQKDDPFDNNTIICPDCQFGSSIWDNPCSLSSMVWVWGKFITEDIIQTQRYSHTYPGNTLCPLKTNLEAISHLTDNLPISKTTPFIDASNIYGTTREESNCIRTFQHGKLKVKTILGEDYIPDELAINCTWITTRSQGPVGALYLLWTREHNRIAEYLHNLTPGSKDEDLFWESRRNVVAQIQAITYNEWLPALLGGKDKATLKMNPPCYETKSDPTVSVEFALSMMKMGHSMVTPRILIRPVPRILRYQIHTQYPPPTSSTIEDPSLWKWLYINETLTQDLSVLYSMESVFAGISTLPSLGVSPLYTCPLAFLPISQSKWKTRIHDGIVDPSAWLAEIDRSREFQFFVPRFSEIWSKYHSTPTLTSWSDISNFTQRRHVIQSFHGSSLSDLPRISLLEGLTSEDPLPGDCIGPTLQTLLIQQFESIRNSDAFFYLWDPNLIKNREVIHSSTLARVIHINSILKLILIGGVIDPDTQQRSIFVN